LPQIQSSQPTKYFTRNRKEKNKIDFDFSQATLNSFTHIETGNHNVSVYSSFEINHEAQPG